LKVIDTDSSRAVAIFSTTIGNSQAVGEDASVYHYQKRDTKANETNEAAGGGQYIDSRTKIVHQIFQSP
jgi:hypothetical protein